MLALIASARAENLVTAIVSDPLTGVAIDGYDAVSYFIESEPKLGSPDYEYDWGGLPWYFVSAANRDVFQRSPETYAPQYGGHCLTSLSRGYLSDGKPQLYIVEALKLYFFYSAANRDAFLLSKSEALAAAAAKWPALSQQLAGGAAAPAPAETSSAPSDASSAPGEAATAPDASSQPAAH